MQNWILLLKNMLGADPGKEEQKDKDKTLKQFLK